MEEVAFQLTLKGEVGFIWVVGSRGHSRQGRRPEAHSVLEELLSPHADHRLSRARRAADPA